MENIKHFFQVVNPNADAVYVIDNDYYINPIAGAKKVTRAEALSTVKPVVAEEEIQDNSRRKNKK
jgi:hypothetical protein